MGTALKKGATPTALAQCVAVAGARRLAQFSLTNELQDWVDPRRTFMFTYAMYKAIQRSPEDTDIMRGIFHGAISIYRDRFLNVPCIRLLKQGASFDNLPKDAAGLCQHLLKLLDRHAMVKEAARVVACYVRLALPLEPLFDSLTFATVREDLSYTHWMVLDAGIHLAQEARSQEDLEFILVGVVRHLAVVCPTPRAEIKPAIVGLRLNKGEKIYEDTPVEV